MILQDAYEHWKEHDAQTHAAAIAFYAALSLGPIILLLLSISKLFFSDDTLAILLIAKEVLGENGATLVQQFLGLLEGGSAGLTIVGFVTLIYAASKVFLQLRLALNELWDVGKSRGIEAIAKNYFVSIAMLLVMVTIIFSSLALIIIIGTLAQFIAISQVFWYVLSVVLSIGMFTLAFGLAFRYVPLCEMPWKSIWQGAFVTALFTEVGNLIIGIVISVTNTASFYGIAGTLIWLMLWIYYAMMVILFGASYTRVVGMTRNAGK